MHWPNHTREIGILASILLSLLVVGIPQAHGQVYAWDTITPVNNGQTLDTTPDFFIKPFSDSDATLNVTLYVDGIASGTENNHANNTDLTITCNRTLTVDDDKIPWHFSLTDSEGTSNVTARDIGIGAYFTIPVELLNPNESSEHWTYYLNESVTDCATSKPLKITDNNITLDGQYNVFDGDDDRGNYGVYLHRGVVETTNCTIQKITLTDWDYRPIHVWLADGNTIQHVIIDSSDDNGINLSGSDSNTLFNVTVKNTEQHQGPNLSGRGLVIVSSHSNTIYNCTFENNYYYDVVFSTVCNNNLFYNNIFNMSQHSVDYGYPDVLSTDIVSSWNTSKQEGTRIYSQGPYIGGNYWTNINGNGWSDTAKDMDGDGFTDSAYNVTISNRDYLAYSTKYPGGHMGSDPGVDPQYTPPPSLRFEIPEIEFEIPEINIPPWGFYMIIGSIGAIGVGAWLSSGPAKRRKPQGLNKKRGRTVSDLNRKKQARANLNRNNSNHPNLKRKK